MNNFFSAFKKSSAEDWKEQIVKDLKGQEHGLLEFNDPIEEIEFKAYYHNEEIPSSSETPGEYPFTRGLKTNLNEWSNGYLVNVDSEKVANRDALDALMSGADLLVFHSNKKNCDWKTVLEGIQFDHMKAQFDVSSLQEYAEITAITGTTNFVSFNFDAMGQGTIDFVDAIGSAFTNKQHPVLLVNGFRVQQAGATSWQEIAFCLNTGHEYLIRLMQKGLSIDAASALIHFHVGVGSNYFNEIAKYRALRRLWAKVIDGYSPEHRCSYNCVITAVIGHTNKSLRDPYTNLLRQTTEVMSATNGADSVLVLPYDLYASQGPSKLAKRMALNISLILKEESYFDKVIDPSGGSYSIEKLTTEIGKKAWSYFQKLESLKGLFNEEAMDSFRSEVNQKQKQRIEAFANGEITGIGMNKYPDPKEQDNNWITPPSYLNMNPIILDLETKNSIA